ncbi:MAG: CBS domain-containing protein [Nanoarchaeota archaeon]|nr:CBS domain-containing protein [Nanoarchaeota archaeon]
MRTGLTVADGMTKEVISVLPEAAVLECAKQMKEEHLGSVLVEKDGALLGILTEQDLVYKVVAGQLDPSKAKVSDIMTARVITISPDKDIYDAIMKMAQMNVRRLPVIDGKELVGMITMKDILRLEPELFEHIVDKIELREEESKLISKVNESEGICELCGNYALKLYETGGSLVCKACKD